MWWQAVLMLAAYAIGYFVSGADEGMIPPLLPASTTLLLLLLRPRPPATTSTTAYSDHHHHHILHPFIISPPQLIWCPCPSSPSQTITPMAAYWMAASNPITRIPLFHMGVCAGILSARYPGTSTTERASRQPLAMGQHLPGTLPYYRYILHAD